MKTKLGFLILSFAVLTTICQCKKNNQTSLQSNKAIIKLYNCNENTGNNSEPYICFDSLIEDSRCPSGVECFWQGTAIIKVTFHETSKAYVFKMSLLHFPSLGFPADTTINGYRIVFSYLQPYPDAAVANIDITK